MRGRGAMSGMRSQIREHMEVVSSCGSHVGRVDQVEGGAYQAHPRR